MIIAIDGPAGSGKSSTAKALAEKLGFTFIDTGAMYRAITHLMLENSLTPDQTEQLIALAKNVSIRFVGSTENSKILLGDKDVTDSIRSIDVSQNVSAVSAIPEIRRLMVHLQRHIAENNHSILDGRDIGTVVFPHADLKVYLTADIRVRAQRRLNELQAAHPELTLDELIKQIETRDQLDMNRSHSPLKMANDAILLDTTALSIQDQISAIEKMIIDKFSLDNNQKGERMTEEVKETLTQNPQMSVTEAYKKSTDTLAGIRMISVEDMKKEDSTIADNQHLMDMYTKTLNKFDPEECVVGHVIRVGDREVVVDVGLKSEGIIPIDEFNNRFPQVGSEIEVFIDRMEDENGQLILSKKKADFLKAWDRIRDVFNNNRIVEGLIQKRIKGGMVVDLFGVEGFLPGSQIDVRPITDFDAFVGKNMQLKIVKLNEARKNIVVSHKEILEAKNKEEREKLLSQIKVGMTIPGRVKNITDFGVFVDMGGLDGLLHITDMSWGKINHPSEMVKIDDVIDVKVIDYDTDKQRVSLGMKQLTPNPWDNIEERYPAGAVVQGKVVSTPNYGLFVELEKGVEGLIHISELRWTQNVKHPSELYHVGDKVEAKVLAVDISERKISMGIKQLQPDPWNNILARYPIGSRVKGIVRTLKQYGAFIELENGIDGLIHVSDLSWTTKVRHPKESLQSGQEIEVSVLDINLGERKISLGLKQLENDPWLMIQEKYKEGTMAKGKVLKVLEKGIIIKLPEDNFEAIVPLSDVNKRDRKNYTRNIKTGQDIELRVDGVNDEERKIVLSREDLFLNEEEKEIAKVIANQEGATQKIDIPDEIRAQIESNENKKGKEPKAAAAKPAAVEPAVVEDKVESDTTTNAQEETSEE